MDQDRHIHRQSRQDQNVQNINWTEVIEAQARSGQSAASYCRSKGIHYDLFLYYRRKVSKQTRLDQQRNSATKSESSFIRNLARVY